MWSHTEDNLLCCLFICFTSQYSNAVSQDRSRGLFTLYTQLHACMCIGLLSKHPIHTEQVTSTIHCTVSKYMNIDVWGFHLSLITHFKAILFTCHNCFRKNQDVTARVVSQPPPLSCYCADHHQLSQALSTALELHSCSAQPLFCIAVLCLTLILVC